MEHTGVYNAHLLKELVQQQCTVWLEAAIRIKKSIGLTRGKSDKIDAYRIARYAYLHQDEARLWKPRREVIERLSHLTTLRKRLLKTKTALQQPLAETKRFLGKQTYQMEKCYTDPVVKAVKKQLQQVEKQIQEIINTDEQLKHLFDLITSVEAIGPVTASYLLIVTNEFKSFNCPKKFVPAGHRCYAGTAPFEHSSGSSIRGKSRVSHLANKEIKTLLHLAAMSAINMKGELANYYWRRVAEGKNKMAILNAIRNKLIKRVFAVVRRNEKYEKIYTPLLA